MSSGRKLFVAGAVAGCLVVLAFIILRHRRPAERPGAPEAVAKREPLPPPGGKAAAAPGEGAPRGGWTIRGRLTRSGEGKRAPAAGASVKLRCDPRRTKSADQVPPIAAAAGEDGSFEVGGMSNRVRWFLDIDDPPSVVLAFFLQLPKGPDGTLELGEIFLPPASGDLAVRLVGPEGAAVEKGWVACGLNRPEQGKLYQLGLSERRREADDRGGGLYVLQRPQRGDHYVQAAAPGFAPFSLPSVELPREEPLVIQLEKGLRISGTVLTAVGTPVNGARIELTGGNVFRSQEMKSDAAGRFIFEGLRDQEHTLQADADGYASTYLEKVPAGTDDQEIRLSKEAILAGRVVDEDNGSPVPGAEIFLIGIKFHDGQKGESDGEGKFDIRKLPPSVYQVSVAHAMFKTLRLDGVELAAGQRLEGQELRLGKGLTAVVTVVDAGSGEPIERASVTLRPERDPGFPERPDAPPSGPDGIVRLNGLEPGLYQLRATARGYLRPKPVAAELAPGKPLETTLSLERGGAISGRVLDGSGQPIAVARCEAQVLGMMFQGGGDGFGGMGQLAGSTDGEGRFLIEGLKAHPKYELLASHSEYSKAVLRGIPVEPGQATDDVEIRLSKGGTIRGRVVDSGGQGVPKASVVVKHTEDLEAETAAGFSMTTAEETAVADEQGRYLKPRLRPGAYDLKAEAESFEPAIRERVALAEGEVLDGVDLILESGQAITGRVVDAAGQPIGGANVRVLGNEIRRAIATDAEGRFQLRGGRSRVQVIVEKAGFVSMTSELVDREPTLTLLGWTEVSGRVRAPGRQSFPNFAVTADAPRTLVLGEQGKGGGDGSFKLSVPEGERVILAMVPGFAPARSAPLRLRAGVAAEGVVIDLVAGGVIEGTVVLRGSGEAVGQAWVQLRREGSTLPSPSFNSSSNGQFRITDLAEGVVDLVVEKAGYAPVKLGSLQVRAGETLRVKAELEPGVLVTGRVTSKGTVLRPYRVFAQGLDELSNSVEGSLDGEGGYSIQLPGPGRYQFMVRFDGFQGGTLVISVPEGVKTVQQDLEVSQGRILGVVVDAATSRPLAGAHVFLMSGESRDGYPDHVATDRQGRFSFSNLSGGVYRLHAVADGFAEGRLDGVEPAEGEPPAVRIPMEAGLDLTAHVFDNEGRPVQGAFTRLRNAKGEPVFLSRFFQPSESREPGVYPLGRVAPGEYRLSVFHPSFATSHSEVKVENEAAVAIVKMQQGAAASIVVQDARGRPVQGARVEVLDQRGESMVEELNLPRRLMGVPRPSTATDDNGRSTLTGRLRAGSYRAYAQQGGARTAEAAFSAQNGETAEVLLRFSE